MTLRLDLTAYRFPPLVADSDYHLVNFNRTATTVIYLPPPVCAAYCRLPLYLYTSPYPGSKHDSRAATVHHGWLLPPHLLPRSGSLVTLPGRDDTALRSCSSADSRTAYAICIARRSAPHHNVLTFLARSLPACIPHGPPPRITVPQVTWFDSLAD